MFTPYVTHHIGITQMPHDHLFQKLWHLGATWVHKLRPIKIDKLEIFLYDGDKIHYQIGFMGQFFTPCVTQYSGITQRAHDYLFQKWGIWVQLGCLNCNQAKINKFESFSLLL